MEEELHHLHKQFIQDLQQISSLEELRNIQIRYLGRKAKLTQFLRSLKDLPDDQRRRWGQAANALKQTFIAALQKKERELFSQRSHTSYDVTLPGRRQPEGHYHLVTMAIEEITDIFSRIGFTRVSYPEVEWDWYAFESLNMPQHHPARDEWETFFIADDRGGIRTGGKKEGRMILTPHTSSGQVREMEKGVLPIRMMSIGKCYRRQMDVSHVPMFHQFEGLVVDEGIHFTHLKGVLEYFVHEFFGEQRKYRFRPFHFQFTEPSFEIDVSCGVCQGKGCRLCKDGWLELGGAGMVHPHVLRAGRINPKKYSGFAFGWGVERTFMMKAGLNLPDIRLLYKNDIRILRQF